MRSWLGKSPRERRGLFARSLLHGVVLAFCSQEAEPVTSRRRELLDRMRNMLKCQEVSAAKSDAVIRRRMNCGSLPVVALQ